MCLSLPRRLAILEACFHATFLPSRPPQPPSLAPEFVPLSLIEVKRAELEGPAARVRWAGPRMAPDAFAALDDDELVRLEALVRKARAD